MREKNCGCCNDNIETKKILLRKINAERIDDDGRTIYVGIVFHICFGDYDESTIETDVDYTISMLNKDYNKQSDNFDSGADTYTDPDLKQTYDQYVSLAAACNIQFYKVDIKYKPISTQTSKDVTVLDMTIKEQSPPVEPNRYLNLWITDLQNGSLGYSQFPWEKNKRSDGVVIARSTFGSNPLHAKYNLNKTMTHEIGHWFGLYHIFQKTFAYEGGNIDYKDGITSEEILQELKGDCIADTPPQALPTYGNPFMTPDSWPTSKATDEQNVYKHMFMNFMDYCDDIVLFMFTQDQKIKMRQMIYIYRPDILTNKLLINDDDTEIIGSDSETKLLETKPSETKPSEIKPSETKPSETKPSETKPSETKPSSSTDIFSPKREISLSCSKKTIRLIGNKLFSSNAKIINSKCCHGKKCLRTKKNGRGEFVLNLLSVKNAVLSVYVRANNQQTYIWIKPVNGEFWYLSEIDQNEHFKHYTLTLPGPFALDSNDKYFIQLGTNSTSSKYSDFDEITIAYS